MQIRRQRDTSQTHTFDARVPHNIQNAQYAAYHRTHLSKNASKPPRIMGWLHGAGEQLHPKRKWQHTVATHERPTSASSPKHETLACGPPPSRKTCLQCAFTSPRRAARQPAHPARDLCTFAAADRKDVQIPRDVITPANAKRQAGGRRGSGSNLHRNGLSKCTSSQQAACRRGWSSSWSRCHSRHKGTAAGRQTKGQAVALGRNPAHGHGEGLGMIAGAR